MPRNGYPSAMPANTIVNVKRGRFVQSRLIQISLGLSTLTFPVNNKVAS